MPYTGAAVSKKPVDSNTTQRTALPRGTAPPSRGACLVVINGERLGQCIDLHDVPVVIGRAPNCDFQIEHKSVSRLHCKVWHENAEFHVRDLGSTNQTFINRRPVDQARLADGDQLAVGDTVLKFVLRGSLEARYHEALYELATVDSLTQLYNRRKFREFLEAAVQRADETGAPLALLFVDLDHFKAINDRLGHSAGDEVLRGVAEALRGGMRPGDLAGRLGGEEFAIVMPDATLEQAMAHAETLRMTIGELRCEVAGALQRVTASMGVATWSPTMTDAAALMKQADLQLFRAKTAGRNRVCSSATPGPDTEAANPKRRPG